VGFYGGWDEFVLFFEVGWDEMGWGMYCFGEVCTNCVYRMFVKGFGLLRMLCVILDGDVDVGMYVLV